MAQSQVSLGFPAGTNMYTETALGATAQSIKASSGTLYLVQADNTNNAAVTYVKFFFASTGNVTVGTTNPDIILAFPASLKNSVFFAGGSTFGTALTTIAVTGGGTTSTAAPGSSVAVNVIYGT